MTDPAADRRNPTFPDLFSGHAELYAKVRPGYPAYLFEFIAKHTYKHRTVWDCGTGNGQAAVSLAKIFDQVSATDASANQISHAVRHENVSYSIQPAEKTDFPDSEFDCVTVAQAVHWFDLDAFYREVNRVLKPGGILTVWGYTWFNITAEIDTIVETTIIDPLRNYWAPQTKLLQDAYRDLILPYPAIEPPAVQIIVRWSLTQLLSYLRSWSPIKSYIDNKGQTALKLLFQELVNLWGAYDSKREIRMPVYMKVCRKP